jgi:hypothetical protein
MSEFEQLAYLSRATVPMDALQNIAEILAVSQRNNWRDGVTGALAFSDGRFLQVVEGRPESIERLLKRVSDDPRHVEIEVVMRRRVADRDFTDWSMAMPRISPETAPMMKDAVEKAAEDPAAAVLMLRRLTEIDAIHS